MSAASDRARFYLEQHVPELQEYERKGIFTREEIRAIASKRSAFEHTVNATGPKPRDYVRYISYESNLDALRKKRCKRLGVKSPNHNGQRTIMKLLERATKKFPGDLGLWMQYIDFCRKCKAHKKLEKVFTQVLRLKPREWELWVMAAKFYAEDREDMSAARSYMQRGLRFCKDEYRLWLEFARMEMEWLVKVEKRKKKVGLTEEKGKPAIEQVVDIEGDKDNDIIMLRAITDEDNEPDANSEVLKQLSSTPALNGALPIAIFDGAMKQFSNSKNHAEIAQDFFELAASFSEQVSATQKILQHILDHFQTNAPTSPEAIICEARMSLYSIDPLSAEFPIVLGTALATVKNGMKALEKLEGRNLAMGVVLMLLPYLKPSIRDELDEDIFKVLDSSLRRYLRLLFEPERKFTASPRGNELAAMCDLIGKLRRDEREKEVKVLEDYREVVNVD